MNVSGAFEVCTFKLMNCKEGQQVNCFYEAGQWSEEIEVVDLVWQYSDWYVVYIHICIYVYIYMCSLGINGRDMCIVYTYSVHPCKDAYERCIAMLLAARCLLVSQGRLEVGAAHIVRHALWRWKT